MSKPPSGKSPATHRGRPRKFLRPSRAVTLTLPEDIIEALRSVDGDLSRAVVRVVQPLVTAAPCPMAEVVTYGGHAVIVVLGIRSSEIGLAWSWSRSTAGRSSHSAIT